jgi:hypothetical protein
MRPKSYTMNGIFGSNNLQGDPNDIDTFIEHNRDMVENGVVEACGITREGLRSIVARNVSRMPWGTGLPERAFVEGWFAACRRRCPSPRPRALWGH